MREIVGGSASSGACPWPCTVIVSDARHRAPMACSVASERRSEFAPRIVSTAAPFNASNWSQMVGSGFVRSKPSSERARLGSYRRRRSFGSPPKVVIAKCSHSASLRPVNAQIAFDPQQPLRLENRADIVQDRRADQRALRPRKTHDVKTAARCPHKMRRGDLVGAQPSNEISSLDRQIVVAPVRVVVRQTTPAIVEGEDAARRGARVGKRDRERVEVLGTARQTGQAYGWRPPQVLARKVVAHMQPQSVRRRVEMRDRACRHHRAPWR